MFEDIQVHLGPMGPSMNHYIYAGLLYVEGEIVLDSTRGSARVCPMQML